MWLVATALYSTGLKAPYLVLPSGQEKELGSGRSLLGVAERKTNYSALCPAFLYRG